MQLRRRMWFGSVVLVVAAALLAGCDRHPLSEEVPGVAAPEGMILGKTPSGPQAGPLSAEAPRILGAGSEAPLPGAAAAPSISPPAILQPQAVAPRSSTNPEMSAATPGILWQNTVSGVRVLWQMNGPQWDGAYEVLPQVEPTWRIKAAADFNGDGRTDLLWQHAPTGLGVIWYMDGSTYTGQHAYLPPVDPAWMIAGAADFNGDNRPDILWQHAGNGQRAIWFMNGATSTGHAFLPAVDPSWQIAGTGDFNGDGKADLLWQHLASGHRAIWYLNGAVFEGQSAALPQVHPSWEIVGVGDYNADGKPDILWQQLLTGWRAIWLMNGAVWDGRGSLLPIVSSDWSIAGAFNPSTAMPSGGRIFGTITLTNEFHPMSAAGADALHIELPRAEPLFAGLGATTPKALAHGTGVSGITAQRAPAPRAEYAPDALLVQMHAAAVAAPAAGSVALQSRPTATRVAAEIRTALAPLSEQHDFEVGLVLPVSLVARVRVPDAARLEEVAAQLKRDPAVAAVVREPIFRHSATPMLDKDPPSTGPLSARDRLRIPNDPRYTGQAWHYNMIEMSRAWMIGTGSRNIVVAVLDTGIRFDHPDIAGNLTNDGFDFVSQGNFTACGGVQVDRAGDGNGYDPDPTQPGKSYMDLGNNCLAPINGSHGLHVAGTIGAVGNNAAGVTGVNWAVSIRPVRVLGRDGGTLGEIMGGVYYAAGIPVDLGNGQIVQAQSRAHVINLSLGGMITDQQAIAIYRGAFQAAAQAGSLIIAAAGNSATDAPSYPAAFPEVISVSAVASNYQLANYSNFGNPARGSKIDIAAPGGQHVVSNGDFYGIRSTDWDFDTNQAVLTFLQGTSMAAPHVAGVAALVLAHQPGLNAQQLRARLLSFAIPMGSASQFGAGLLNARNSITQTTGAPRATRARLYDASTGAILRNVAAPNGQYDFTGLEPGNYFVLGGEDADGDGDIGVPGRRFGGFTAGGNRLQALSVGTGASLQASFAAGAPGESEPNESAGSASRLVLNGYVFGARSPQADADWFVINLPAGQYTFETSGHLGSCGFIGELDTVLFLYNSGGQQIATNDDISGSAQDYCSRITQTLSAGTYYVRVRGYQSGGSEHTGTYRLEVRSGA